ncbi:cytochrome c biogenesis CcdA family protein [Streptomyces halobius]|uniref:Cytochrome c biogenesis CcdA family protein n=1 Tax=Streptomyces halobius TaxID=2879846 RepID=A0ABY4M2H6_9ACTN|nr:cytochrome c biogenesis CcdA family protein [Streptomyces halobius]UQA91947.1 cytochrome c biogenesis CcdA family protein [Streptomyces halobius]
MSSVPYALAFAAGMLAAINPCGFALLPAYLTLFVSGTDNSRTEPERRSSLVRALVATAAMTGGFAAVFGAFALIVCPLALSVERWLPWVTVAIGLVLLALGVWLLTGRELRVPVPKVRATSRPAGSAWTMTLYGISYAIASLSCTIGPFLALTSAAFRTGSLPGVVGVFAVYAAGMGAVVGVLTLAVALSRQALISRIRRALPYVTRASGALLLSAGGYVAYYGWYELRLLHGHVTEDPVVGAATRWQGEATRWLDGLGPAPVLTAVAVLLVAGWAVHWATRRHRSVRSPRTTSHPGDDDAPHSDTTSPGRARSSTS